jgi:tetratricopeptide (TPR) repeat protein
MEAMKMLTTLTIAAVILAAPALAGAQAPPAPANQETVQVRQMFEAGQHQQVIEAATAPDAQPPVLFTAGLSHQKLGAVDQARDMYRRLAELPEENAWRFIGLSAQQLLDNQNDQALASAQRAVKMSDMLADAHQQLGLVLAKRQAWREAAMAFDRASEVDPMYAYAYYYGGLTHSRANRPDLMAVRFERFLKLAPEAPERPEVLQLMRTIRGR